MLEPCEAQSPGDMNTAFSPAAPDRLPSTLDLTQAQALREKMIALLSAGTVQLDAGDVERMSTPCAQVLLAAGCAAEAAGTSFQIVKGSDVFLSAVADLGLKSQFTRWMV